MKKTFLVSCAVVMLMLAGLQDAKGQWAANGNNIYNTNSGYVGIGNNSPTTLLYVAKNMTEPAITVRNLGGAGGATYSMVDQASGANWKFKATSAGGFKIRDHAHALDVLTFEANSFANALYINSAGSTGMGTNTPAASAVLEINSTTMGFLPPRITSQQIAMVANPSNGLVVYNTSDEHLYFYSSQSSAWNKVSYAGETIGPGCGSSFTITHVAGDVAPVNKTVTYSIVGNIPGEPSKCWITQNLGSDHQATAVDDATEASAGWYWQFNRKQGYKHDGTTRTPNTAWITSINENSDWLTINDPCNIELGSVWRLPTITEYENLVISGGWNDWNGPWSSALKMHAAGYLSIYGHLGARGLTGFYWSSNQGSDYLSAYYLFLNIDDAGRGMFYKADGFSIRCLRD